MDEKTRHLSAWLSYTLTSQIKAAVRRQLAQEFEDPHCLIDAVLNGALPQSIERQRLSSDVQHRVEQALHWQTQAPDRHIVTLTDPHYPALLASINLPPSVLYVQGKLDALSAPHVAIVGARKATPPALETTHQLAAGLATAGVAVVSGLALGVDAAAHRGCLDANGRTVAVAATPPDVIYPQRHRQLAHEITENGAIITEFPLGTPLRAGCFPQRNRIISGLSLATVVVEAALPSGTLLTAKHAAEQDREVMAVPGSIRNPLTKGCHALIKDGALLIESVNDILGALSLPLSRHLATQIELPIDNGATISDPDALLLLANLGYDPVSADELSSKTSLCATRTTRALGKLELLGVIKRSAGRYGRR